MAGKKGMKHPSMKGNKYAIGNKGGRPTIYKPEYCNLLIKYFEIPPSDYIEIPHYKSGKVSWVDKKRVANTLPKYHEFAKTIGVHHDTLIEWTKKYKEFSEAYSRAKELQKYFLIENGLNGCYNAAFAVFVCKNITDMSDRTELTGKDGKDLIPPARVLTKEEAKVFLKDIENGC